MRSPLNLELQGPWNRICHSYVTVHYIPGSRGEQSKKQPGWRASPAQGTATIGQSETLIHPNHRRKGRQPREDEHLKSRHCWKNQTHETQHPDTFEITSVNVSQLACLVAAGSTNVDVDVFSHSETRRPSQVTSIKHPPVSFFK